MHEAFPIWKYSSNETKEKMNQESIKRCLEQALEHANNEVIIKRMLRFAIDERRYTHRVMIGPNFEHVFELRAERWLEARFFCKTLINIYRRGKNVSSLI